MSIKGKDERETRTGGRYGTGHPGVTTILSVIHKPALENWKMSNIHKATLDGATTLTEAKKLARDLSSKACLLGERVHKIVEDDLPTDKIPVDLIRFHEAYVAWKHQYKPKFLAHEVTVTSEKYFYKGTLDMIAEIDGEICLVDVKTGKGIYADSVCPQLSAYQQAFKEQGRGEIDKLYVLLLKKDYKGEPTGEYEFKEMDYKFNVFEAALKIYNFKQEYAK